MPSSVDQLLEPGQVGRRRLGVGGEAGDRLEVQPVAREVAEGLVADDRGRALAGARPSAYSCVERPRARRAGRPRCPRTSLRRRGRARPAASATASPRSAIRSGSCQKCGSRSPWSWPASLVLVLVLGGGHQVDHVGGVDDRPRRARWRRPSRRRRAGSRARGRPGRPRAMAAVCLMSRLRSCGSVPGSVRLVDLPLVARHLLGHPGQRVERRDGRATVPGAVVGPAAAGKEERPRRGRWRGRRGRATDNMRTILTMIENHCQTGRRALA